MNRGWENGNFQNTVMPPISPRVHIFDFVSCRTGAYSRVGAYDIASISKLIQEYKVHNWNFGTNYYLEAFLIAQIAMKLYIAYGHMHFILPKILYCVSIKNL